jgi:hypothetical protein
LFPGIKNLRTYTEEPSGSELGEAKSGEPQRTTEINGLTFFSV